MSTPNQKAALFGILHGRMDGIKQVTLDSLYRRGWITQGPEGFTLTKRGKRIAENKAGGNLPEVRRAELRARLKSHKAPKKKRDRATTAKEKREHLEGLAGHFEKRKISMTRILGASGRAHAVKIARADGGSFTASDVASFERAGWKVLGAGTAPAKPGASGVPGVVFADSDWVFTNPARLGPSGLARALVLAGSVDREVVEDLAAAGYDVTAAPKKLREGITRNPGPEAGKRIYAELVKAAKKRQALNASELAARIKLPVDKVEKGLLALERLGLAFVAGKDLFGECWRPGAPEAGLFRNPGKPSKATAARIAKKKAAAWFWDENQLTEPQELVGYEPPTSGILIGQAVAVEYRSKKDGTTKVYRHDVTKKRDLILSVDGSTIIINPPFKVTKRGIEG